MVSSQTSTLATQFFFSTSLYPGLPNVIEYYLTCADGLPCSLKQYCRRSQIKYEYLNINDTALWFPCSSPFFIHLLFTPLQRCQPRAGCGTHLRSRQDFPDCGFAKTCPATWPESRSSRAWRHEVLVFPLCLVSFFSHLQLSSVGDKLFQL